jgi:hypothetical protein
VAPPGRVGAAQVVRGDYRDAGAFAGGGEVAADVAEELGATPRQIQSWLEHLRQASFEFSFFRRAAFAQIAGPSSQLRELGVSGA